MSCVYLCTYLCLKEFYILRLRFEVQFPVTLLCLCIVFAARRIYPQVMTVILTDGYLKVIHPRCVSNIRIKSVSTPSNRKYILNNFKTRYMFQLK